MEKLQNDMSVVERTAGVLQSSATRRKFLRNAGLTTAAGVAILAVGCKKDEPTTPAAGTVDLGSGDVGILNYAYALEQLEAAFYVQAVSTPYTGMSAAELAVLTDIRDHEVIHREFFKAALGSNAIQGLTPNFSSIDFTSRLGILNAAKAFEDTGVSAYNGAAQYISDINYLGLAGKIVSVEARHAALIRDLISNGTFADELDANAKDIEKTPTAVVDIANTFLTTKISKRGLPA